MIKPCRPESPCLEPLSYVAFTQGDQCDADTTPSRCRILRFSDVNCRWQSVPLLDREPALRCLCVDEASELGRALLETRRQWFLDGMRECGSHPGKATRFGAYGSSDDNHPTPPEREFAGCLERVLAKRNANPSGDTVLHE